MDEKEISNNFLLKQIYDELNYLKKALPNQKNLQLSLDDLKNDQKEMKKDLQDLKTKLLDPENGVIVKVNENTKFRLSEENNNAEYINIKMDMQLLKRWKDGVNKALWLIFGSIIGIVIKIIFSGYL